MIETYLILERVNNFYTESFNHLLTITGAIFALFGIILPILISIYQNRIFKLDQKSIEASIKETIKNITDEKILEIDSYYQKRESALKDEIQELEVKIKKDIDEVIGGIFQVQANSFSHNKNYIDALDSYLKAAIKHIKSDSEANLKSTLFAINDCLTKINKTQLENDVDIEKSMKDLISDLEAYNINSRYAHELKSLKNEYSQAQLRQA